MVNIGNFDANSVVPSEAFEPLPPGWYAASIVESEVKQTKNGDDMLKMTLQLDEARHPTFKGRKVWLNLNLWNNNAQAKQIAQRDLSAICKAVGVAGVSDTSALHNIPLAIKIAVRPAKGDYDASNDVKGYDALMARFPSGSGASGAPGIRPAGAAQTASSSATPAATPPWAKK